MKTGDILNGKYKILRKLQEGGQATLFLAATVNETHSFTKEVAIKVFDKEDGPHEEFLSEVNLLSELNHPNIARIYDAGIHEGYPFIVLEHIDGLNLKELREKSFIKRIDISVGDIFVILEKVLDALIFAHQFKANRILHRDVSPSNIMISNEGFVKLLDFGVSGISTDRLVGNPAYLPDSILEKKKNYSEATDLYSLAVVIYELITLKKIKEESELDLTAVQNKKLRTILKKLLNASEFDEKDILKEIRKVGTELDSNLASLIRKSSDEMYLVDGTLINIPKQNKLKKSFYQKNIQLIGLSFVLILTSASLLYWLNKNNLKSMTNFYLQNGKSNSITLIVPPKLDFSFPVTNEDRERFSLNSCENYCHQGIMGLTYGQKKFFETLKKNPSNELGSTSYDVYFDHYLPVLSEGKTHFYAHRKMCSNSRSCSTLNSLYKYLEMELSSPFTEAEYNMNLQSIMSGNDKEFSSIAQDFSKGTLKPVGKNYKYHFRNTRTGSDSNLVQFNGSLDRQICRDIGDEAFLDKSRFKDIEKKAFLLNDFDVIIFNKILNPRYQGEKNELPIYSLKSLKTIADLKICHYQRSEGRLTVLQVWTVPTLK